MREGQGGCRGERGGGREKEGVICKQRCGDLGCVLEVVGEARLENSGMGDECDSFAMVVPMVMRTRKRVKGVV